jgi:hypothetical protein
VSIIAVVIVCGLLGSCAAAGAYMYNKSKQDQSGASGPAAPPVGINHPAGSAVALNPVYKDPGAEEFEGFGEDTPGGGPPMSPPSAAAAYSAHPVVPAPMTHEGAKTALLANLARQRKSVKAAEACEIIECSSSVALVYTLETMGEHKKEFDKAGNHKEGSYVDRGFQENTQRYSLGREFTIKCYSCNGAGRSKCGGCGGSGKYQHVRYVERDSGGFRQEYDTRTCSS